MGCYKIGTLLARLLSCSPSGGPGSLLSGCGSEAGGARVGLGLRGCGSCSLYSN